MKEINLEISLKSKLHKSMSLNPLITVLLLGSSQRNQALRRDSNHHKNNAWEREVVMKQILLFFSRKRTSQNRKSHKWIHNWSQWNKRSNKRWDCWRKNTKKRDPYQKLSNKLREIALKRSLKKWKKKVVKKKAFI